MDTNLQPAAELQRIRDLMSRSSRFISLSGLSGIAAGVMALAGAGMAYSRIDSYYGAYEQRQGYEGRSFQALEWDLMLIAAGVLIAALVTAFYFTWRRAGRLHTSIWDRGARLLMINMAIPLVTGGLVILSLLQKDQWQYIGSLCLIFYGLALVNGSKYTLSDIRYLGLTEIVLGLISFQFPKMGLHFWAVGFGVMHILYGFAMWWKNERKVSDES